MNNLSGNFGLMKVGAIDQTCGILRVVSMIFCSDLDNNALFYSNSYLTESQLARAQWL